MQTGMSLQRIWQDDELIELRVVVSNQASVFTNTVYTSRAVLLQQADALRLFQHQVHGGLCDLLLGEFGPEYANGGLRARLHFRSPGALFVSTHQQAEHEEFSCGQVAAEARMFLRSEPGLLNAFIQQFQSLAAGEADEAMLGSR